MTCTCTLVLTYYCILHLNYMHWSSLVLLNFRLVEAGKQLFVITNSPFETVDKGMSFMVGASWRDLFDVIIVQV